MAEGVRRHGLTQLATGQVHGQPPTVDVVFVHGLFGHPYRTWACKPSLPPGSGEDHDRLGTSQTTSRFKLLRQAKPDLLGKSASSFSSSEDQLSRQPPEETQEVYWPRDLLPSVLPTARVFTWGYDVDVVHFLCSTSQASISHHAESLLSDLADVRISIKQKSTKILFVVHSLGGLVVKKAMCSSATSKTHLSEILPQTAGICFLGTPHRGSRVAPLGKLAAELSRLFLTHPNTGILRALENGSESLESISQDFSRLLVDRKFHIYSFREQYPTYGIMIVDHLSSTIGDGLEDSSTIPDNHRDMTKFATEHAQGFIRISSVLKRWKWECRNSAVGEVRKDQDKCLNSIHENEANLREDDIEAPYESTYSWILASDSNFVGWLCHQKSGIFWISGIPGSGKSTAMKFTLKNPKTRALLQSWDSRDWVVSGFFFHDRGSHLQRSVSGLLAEIIFKILRVHRDLIAKLVLPLYRSKLNSLNISPEDDMQTLDKNRVVKWSDKELQDILISISSQRDVNVNVCLFIDGLDEHTGDHRQLLSILQRFVSCANSSTVRLKLCLASRPENIFKDALGGYPGFAIHTETGSDIQQFVYGKMAPELSLYQPSEPDSSVQRLVQEVVERAQGVFLWVNLVVAELVEGICDGDSIQDLRLLLLAIPPELGSLYERTLTRKSRRSLPQIVKKRQAYERWVMFQIALCAPRHISLMAFIRATTINLATLDGAKYVKESMGFKPSEDEMLRRLAVRCSGLFDAPRDRMSYKLTVRLIHQTVEEFIRTPKATEILSADLPKQLHHDGYICLLRAWILSKSSIDVDSLTSTEIFALVRLVSNMSRNQLNRFYTELHYKSPAKALESLWANLVAKEHSFQQFQETSNIDLGYLIIYTYWVTDLPLADLTNDYSHSSETKDSSGRLLACAVWCRVFDSERFPSGPWTRPDILQSFLDAGIPADARYQKQTAVEIVINHAMLHRGSDALLADITRTLLASGAEPDQTVSCWEDATALIAATRADQQALAAVFLEYGADPNVVDAYGKRAADYEVGTVLSEEAAAAVNRELDQIRQRNRTAIGPEMSSMVPMICVAHWGD